MDKGEIKLAGNGVINEGTYSRIKIMGNANSKGHVIADEMQIMGNAYFEGDLEGGFCTIYGNAHIIGNISIVKLKVNGDLHVEGDCKVQELTVNGNVNMTGEVEGKNIVTRGGLSLSKVFIAKQVKVCGDLNSPTDISAEDMVIEGKVLCKGLLSAEHITLHSCADSYCREIGATSLVVEKPNYHLLWLTDRKNNVLVCDMIEADEMKLTNVEAKAVRGKKINLVSGCNIHTVEYSDEFNQGNGCVVSEFTKTI